MKHKLIAVAILATSVAYSQAPPAKTAPAAAPAVDAATVKSLKDALNIYQLDQMAVQTAKGSVAQSDPVAKRAMEILNQALDASPEVQKANAQEETDRKTLLAKIDALRKSQKLDNSYDWDFNQGKFVKTAPPAK